MNFFEKSNNKRNERKHPINFRKKNQKRFYE